MLDDAGLFSRRVRMQHCRATFAAIAVLSASMSPAADFYWDANTTNVGTGGNGNWMAGNAWRVGAPDSTTATAWTDFNTAHFGGSAGDVFIGLSSSTTTVITTSAAYFHVTGYALAPYGGSQPQTLSGPVSLGAGVNLRLMLPAAGGNRFLNLNGSVTGGAGSGLTFQATGGSMAQVRLGASGIDYGVPISVVTSDPLTGPAANGGYASFLATAAGTTISADIANDSSATTMLGAASGASLTFAGRLSGRGGLQFGADSTTSAGEGVVHLTARSTYAGTTTISTASRGAVRLGVTNALPTSTRLVFGGSIDTGSFDLNGFDQQVGSLSSGTGTFGPGTLTGTIINTAAGTGTSTLTVGGADAPPAFAGVIRNGNTAKTALVKTGAGTLTLTGANIYTGGTTVTGGRLLANNLKVADSATGAGPVVVSDGGQLAGTGRAAGPVTVGQGGVIAAGVRGTSAAIVANETVGKFTTGDQVWQTGGTARLKYTSGRTATAAGTGYDTLAMGLLNLADLVANGKFNLVILKTAGASFDLTQDAQIRIASATGVTLVAGGTAVAANTDLSSLFELDTASLGVSNTPSMTYFKVGTGSNAGDLTLRFDATGQAAPEPTTVGLVALGGVSVLGRRRRRRMVNSAR